MLNLTKINRSLLAIAAIGAIGFSTYGVFNIVNAASDPGLSLPTDYPGINMVDDSGSKPDGTFCNPYGCVGCNGCLSLQYRQAVEEASGPTVELNYEN
jgi:hypothetical protein